MKNIVLIFLGSFLITTAAWSQVEFGLRVGTSSYDLADSYLKWKNKEKPVENIIQDASYGYHFGAYLRARIIGLYVEPAVLFNSNNVSYMVPNAADDIKDLLKNERYNSLDIPLMVGLKIALIRAHIGPVAHLYIDSSSDLTQLSKFQEKFKDATFGYQFGVGLDIQKFRIDINYESNFSNWGVNMKIGNTVINFDDKASRVLASLSYRF